MEPIQEEHVVQIHQGDSEPQAETSLGYSNSSVSAVVEMEPDQETDSDAGHSITSEPTIPSETFNNHKIMPENDVISAADTEMCDNSDYGSTTQLGVQSNHPNYAHMVGTAQKYVIGKKKKSPAKQARKCCGLTIMVALFLFVLISILIGYYSEYIFDVQCIVIIRF